MWRTHLRGHASILKRLLVHIGGFNLGLLMRTLVGIGTPRGGQGRLATAVGLIIAVLTDVVDRGRDVVDHEARLRPHHQFAFFACRRQSEPVNHGLLGSSSSPAARLY